MAASNSNLIKFLIVGGAGLLGMMAWKKKLLPAIPNLIPEEDPTTPFVDTQAAKAKPVVPLSVFPLKKGSRGEYVKTLQKHLGVSADGIFGPATEAALLQRYGKRQVMTLSDLNGMVKTATSNTTQPATQPSLPKPVTAAPAKKATTTANPVTTAKPATTAASDFQKKLTAQMWTVFGGIWSKANGSPLYTERFFGDWKAITPVLASMSDSYLKGFILSYSRSFKGLQFAKNASRNGTLMGDLQRMRKDRTNAAYFVQLARVKKLS